MRQRYWPGDTVRVRVAFKDEQQEPMVASGVTITALRPDGSLVVGVVQGSLDAGLFFADIVADQPGTWALRAICTGPTATAVEGEFDVAPSKFLTPGSLA